MDNKSYLFTSESVSEGHPDKVCDRISDMVVDSYLKEDPTSKVACETLATTNRVVLAGEVRGANIPKNELLQKVNDLVNIPVIASGGAGNLRHLYEAFNTGKSDAVLAASIFHFGKFSIKEAKEYLISKNVSIRL